MVSVGLNGEMIILAPRERLYRALGDTDVVRRAIPDCRAFVSTDEGYRCELDVAGLGCLTVDIVVSHAEAPAGLSFRAEAARGHPPGYLRVSAHIALAAIDVATTNLAYHVSTSASGFFADLLGSNPKARCEVYADNVLASLARVVEDHEPVAGDMSSPILPEPSRQAPAATAVSEPGTDATTRSAVSRTGAAAPFAAMPAARVSTAGAEPAMAAAPSHVSMQAMAPTAAHLPGASQVATGPQFAGAAAGIAPNNLTYAPPAPPAPAWQSTDDEPAPNLFVRLFFVAVGVAIIAILLRDAF